MGQQVLSIAKDPESRKLFLKHLLHDVEAIEKMLDEKMFESGITRIGAEQEFCLVDNHFKPSLHALEILEKINDPHFTPELARYNLEINLDPLELKGNCFSKMEENLKALLKKAEVAAETFNEKIILTGILPSIDYRAVQLKYMTPKPRYEALANIIYELRGEDFELNISGVDELILNHNNILFEACNTSFQCHLQIEPDQFPDMYNWAQMLSGPILSVCANSPLLLGRQLWAETRIPLFQQSIDTRGKGYHLREREQRVTFGNRWVKSVADVYKNDIARHTLLFMTDIKKDSLEQLENGKIPKLEALRLHNGTIYKWNRPCYGISDGIPHLRIENRYLPSGPTVDDEIANLAFWVGLMNNMPKQFSNNWDEISFEEVKENFYKAAMWGIQSGMIWDGKLMSARALILDVLLPMAREGLEAKKINKKDIDKYLSIIEGRAENYATGSRWIVNSYRKLKKKLERDESVVALTGIMYSRRLTGDPVYKWKIAEIEEAEQLDMQYDIVRNTMSTDLITANENDLAELVLKVMEWRDIRHLPVEDNRGNLKGIITKKRLLRYLEDSETGELAIAADVMEKDPITIGPDEDVKFAILLMLDKKISSLPVVDNGELIGILTDKDTAQIWQKMKKRSNVKN
ncbi:MAG: CBS domain-containing protein [Balneolaceae bacterium]|nr:MAG: CBS domain-containing protein [Balneolaceae bacterium]